MADHEHIAGLGFTSDFTIYDDRDSERLLTDVLAELHIPEAILPSRLAAALIDGAKNRGEAAEDYARRDGPRVAPEGSEDVLRNLDDLAGRAVAHAQGLDAIVRYAKVVEHVGPSRKAVLGRDRLRGVAGQRDAPLGRGGLEQDGELDRGEVLHLVHHQVLVDDGPLLIGQRPPLQLVKAQEQGIVLRVEGDSMIDAGILEGDYVVVRPADDARDGEMVVALVGDEDATVKRFFREKDHIRLQPENRSMKPIRTPDVSVVGRVVGVFRRVP